MELLLADNERVLDVGFGNGFMLKGLAKKYKCDFYGIDVSADMLTAASRRNEQTGSVGSIKLTLGDVVRTNFDDGFFDKIYTVNTVYFWSDLSSGLTEINRILRENGVFVNAVYSREWLDKLPFTRIGFVKYTINELIDAGEQCGFAVQAVSFAKGKSYCLVYRKSGR
jgi:ubiquinone/menaquinone biosynthesis C-methylase UbiE